jgi:ACS family tartrate transporter-like MFS transporter
MPPDPADSLERRVVSKVSSRLLPYLFLLYIIAYIDRINIGVARLQMPRDLPMDPDVYGFGAGLFFVGYFLFEVPSNLILERVGARIWIARIMVLWGLVSASMMFVKSVQMFYLLRFLLGVAEAGFFPGILFYLTRWFRGKDLARTIALFMTAGTLAGVVGNPLSGALLRLDGAGGLKGWQWLFLLEGLPAVLLGLSVLVLLTERPESARWLAAEECAWLTEALARERRQKEYPGRRSLLQALCDPRVLLLSLTYFLIATSSYGFEMWLPVILKPLGKGSDFRVTLLSAIPYIAATVGMVLIGRNSDRTGERRWHVAASAFASMAGFLGSAFLHDPVLSLAALSLAFVGLKGTQGPFWALPPAFLSGPVAAGGIAFINSVGNLGGQAGPWLMGWLQKKTGAFSTGLAVSASLLLLAGLLALCLKARPEGHEPSGGSPV